MTEAPILEIEDLHVSFNRGEREVKAVQGANLVVRPGEIAALVGESGSGKSVTALSAMRLLPYPLAWHPKGSIRFKGEEILSAPEDRVRALRGDRMSMIFQEPLTSLNPLQGIGRQVAESVVLHRPVSAAAARERVVELFELVGLREQIARMDALPHEFSGGQQQRVMIAMALANTPDLLIADEPTTAVDVTIQAQILKLLQELQARLGMAVLFITHDLGIVRRIANRAYVMCQGRIVEEGVLPDVFRAPRHDYTRHLLASEPKGTPEPASASAPEIMACKNLKVWFPIKRGVIRRVVGHVKAVDGVTLSVREGHTLGIVGESGSGKSTLGRALLRLERSEGEVAFRGRAIEALRAKALRPLRREMQIVFQDPFGSLSPRLSVGQIVEEGLLVHGQGGDADARRQLIGQALTEVGLDPETQDRYPHEFSGGQRQRIAIARALVLKPKFVVLDEPTSALDVSVQAQIVELLRELQKKHRLAYLFISHDLRVVRAMAHEIAVLRQGRVVEHGPAADIFARPREPYTRALIAAAIELKADESGAVAM
ncbi:MAG: ABC transporter ATP-binding protein [Rhodospirillales bacterium]|nr:ABC transporter ATP-binding protein [Rhodospirillales bacterium]MSP79702.1 ABC transporter ATP-binding protein [Rhodospirillales bacterium]